MDDYLMFIHLATVVPCFFIGVLLYFGAIISASGFTFFPADSCINYSLADRLENGLQQYDLEKK